MVGAYVEVSASGDAADKRGELRYRSSTCKKCGASSNLKEREHWIVTLEDEQEELS